MGNDITTRPKYCEACASANPQLVNDPDVNVVSERFVDHWVCRNRRACEARQMLQAGASSDEAARHAQRL